VREQDTRITDTAPQGSAVQSAAPRGDAPRWNLQLIGIYAALLVMWIVLTILSPYFFTVQNIRTLLISASTLSLIGAALTIVLIAGEIDLSFAAMQAFAGSVSAILIIEAGVPWPLGMLIAIAIGTGAGVVSGVVTVIGRLPTFITTLAMLGIVQGTAFLLTNGQPVANFPDAYQAIGNNWLGPVPYSILVPALFYVALHFMLTRTVFGLHIFAVGGNKAAAESVGISWARTTIAVLALAAFLSSVSGIVITSRLNAGSGTYGADDLLPAVAGVIIGGTSLTGGVGSLWGTFGGIMIVVTIADGLTLLNVSQFWQQILVGVIIMGAVLIDQATRGSINAPFLKTLVPGLRRRPGRARSSE
jgi:ribose/xylose/arabinose/galactoside ABC-type transport system permease subunit